MKKPIIIAHRGASAYAPENTMAAFKMAIEMKAKGIEIDVHLTKDGHPVVIHDNKLDRTSNGKGLIRDKTLKELKELDFGSWFSADFKDQSIPTLEEALDFTTSNNVMLNIELKSGIILYQGIERTVADIIRQYKAEDKVIVSSFNHYSLLELKKMAPRIKIGLLYSCGLVAPWEYAKRIGAEAIHPLYISIPPEAVKDCNDNGILVNPYTIDVPEHIRAAILAGVDGIITNVPDIAHRIASELD